MRMCRSGRHDHLPGHAPCRSVPRCHPAYRHYCGPFHRGDRAMVTATQPMTGRHLIAGKWQTPPGALFESTNPARLQEILGVFPSATDDEAAEAVAAARRAYPAWRRTSRIFRADLFDNLA